MVSVSPAISSDILLHLALILCSTVLAGYLIKLFFFTPHPAELDDYYLKGAGTTKMVYLKGKPSHLGGKYWLYTAEMYKSVPLGADMRKVSIHFDYVSDQSVDIDNKKNGRYTVEPFGTKGVFQFVETEGSDIDVILRRNVDRPDGKPFQFNIKGPFGSMWYKGKGQFYDTYKDLWTRPQSFLFVAEEENLQAFWKVIMDLHKTKPNSSVTLLYFCKTTEEVLYLADLEFLQRTHKNWTVRILLEDTEMSSVEKNSEIVQKGLPGQDVCYKGIGKKDNGIKAFVSVHLVNRVDVASKLENRGFKPEDLQWVQ